MSYFYHEQAIDILYPGSEYLIKGQMYVGSGAGTFNLSIQTYDASSSLFTQAIAGQLGTWTEFVKAFQVDAVTSGPLMLFNHTGTVPTEAWFDEISLAMPDLYEEQGAIQIYPELDFKDGKNIIRSENQCKAGGKFVYNWGSYRSFEVNLKFVQDSNAELINEWWAAGNPLLLKINSGSAWDTTTCYPIQTDRPMSKKEKPYVDYFSGKLVLESIE